MTRSRKVTYHLENKQKLNELCEEIGCEVVWLNMYQARIITGVVIVDIWTPRMKYNVINIDGVEQPPRYKSMSSKFDIKEVSKLLKTGSI